MPTYRISRYTVTDTIDVEASSPEEAVATFSKAGVRAQVEFSHTVIEEVVPPPKQGYRSETSADVIGTRTP